MSAGQALKARPGTYPLRRPATVKAAPAPVRRQRRAPFRWALLWAPELVALGLGLEWLIWRLWPRPTVPTPAKVTVHNLYVWWDAIVWPSAGEARTQVILVLVILAMVALVDMVVLRDRRLARRLHWRWDRATKGSSERAKLRHIRRRGGIFDATVVLRSGNWAALKTDLDPEKGSLLRNLRLGRRLKSPVRAQVTAAGDNTARTQSLRLYYKPLPLPDAFPAYEKAAQGAKVFVGHSVDGPVMVDLDDVPHIQVVGDTGTGKGQFIQLLQIQSLRAGWLHIVLDGGGSPEYAILDPAPTVLRPMRIEMTLEQRLEAAIGAIALLKAMADARSAVIEAFGKTRWADLPPDVKAWLPRISLTVDETTKLLSPSKDKKLDELRQRLATALDTDALRNGRKFGIHVLPIADQFAYSVVFSRGAQRQASNVVVLGNMAVEHVRQVTGLSGLPSVPEVPRCGHFVRFGNPRFHETRIPFESQALTRAVEYVVAQTGGRS